MAPNTHNTTSAKHLPTAAWALLFPLAMACGVQAPTKNITGGNTTPSAPKPQEQAATKSEGSEQSGSVALLMPVGMPDSIDQVRLSLARQTPQLESLYNEKEMIDADMVAIEEKLTQIELPQGNTISNMMCWGGGESGACSPIPPGLIGSGGAAIIPPIFTIGGDSIKALDDRIRASITPAGIAAEKERIKAEQKALQTHASAVDAELDAQLTAAAKSDPKGQQLFPLGLGMPQLQRFDLKPGQYLLLVEVLDSTTGKVYQKGRGKVEIPAGQVAEANIKLVPVSQPEGGLIINLNGSPSGFTMNGESKVCPTPTPADICPLKHVILSESEELWQYSCKALGYQLISCVSNKCQYPIPREGTQLCSGLVK